MNLYCKFVLIFLLSRVTSDELHPSDLGLKASTDAELLKDALYSGNIDTVVNILTSKRYNYRRDIADAYEKKFGKNLKEELEHHVKDEVKNLLGALVQLPLVFYAAELRKAMVGVGTDKYLLIEVLCTLSSDEIWALSNAYQSEFQTKLTDDVENDTTGDFKTFLVSLLNPNRDGSTSTDKKHALVDAKKLYQAGVQVLGTDEEIFYDIFSTRNSNQLRLILDEYKSLTGHEIEDAIKAEFSGYIREALLTFISACKNLPLYFAKQINKALDVQHEQLNRIVVTRSEIDMSLIKQEYSTVYGNQLSADILTHSKGLYKEALLNLINLQ